MIRVDSQQKVIFYTFIITSIALLVPVTVVATVLGLMQDAPAYAFWTLMPIAVLVPLLITPPVSLMVLTMLRRLDETLDRVDGQIRFDPLTGIFNRGYLLDQVRAAQSGGALLIIDADHFKKINDTHGHAAGDAALVVIANAIAQTVGPNGITGRLGGEEFAAFLPGATPATGVDTARAVCQNIRRLDPLIEGKPIKLSVSIGCTMHPKSALIGKSMKLADDLLYKAKSNGRDRVEHDLQPVEERERASAALA
jgi:diguanylate cyclase